MENKRGRNGWMEETDQYIHKRSSASKDKKIVPEINEDLVPRKR